MKEKDLVSIDTNNKSYPVFIEKNTQNSQAETAWINCIIQFENGEEWTGKVISFSTNGIYKVELLKKND